MTKKSKKSKREAIKSLHHVPSLQETIARLSADKKINKEREDYINSHLEGWVADSKYILFNLGVHLAMGVVRFTATPFPLPIGSTIRPLWVMACRMYCNLRWDMNRKRVHSIPVLLFSIIPFLGYFAYTIPLKKKSEYLTYLYVQHIAYMMYDKTFEEKLAKTPKFIRKIGYALLLPEEYKHREK